MNASGSQPVLWLFALWRTGNRATVEDESIMEFFHRRPFTFNMMTEGHLLSTPTRMMLVLGENMLEACISCMKKSQARVRCVPLGPKRVQKSRMSACWTERVQLRIRGA